MSSGEPSATEPLGGLLLISVEVHLPSQTLKVLFMSDTMNAKSRVPELFDEKKWRYIGLLYSAGVLLLLALLLFSFRLWLLLRHCRCGT
jgi:hypothetical protein